MASPTLAGERPTETARWVLPVVLPFAAVLALHVLIAPGATSEALSTVGTGALWGGALIAGLVVTVAGVLAVTGLRAGAERARVLATAPATWIAVAVVAYFILLTAVASRMWPLPFFDVFERHWQGKVLDLLWVAILFAILHRWAREEAGLRWRIRRGSMAPAMITIGAVFALYIGLTALAVALDPASSSAVDLERIAFNATIPNLTEELIWRGAMLAVLDRVFGTPRTLFGAEVGWGLVITAVVFGLGHAILVDLDTGEWSLNIAGGVFAGIMGLALAWIWARTGSIWPAFLLHCAPELGVDVGMAIAG
ncbi:CPBP family intramembrane glutamic endopeptidase [Glycomyces tarimensis]